MAEVGFDEDADPGNCHDLVLATQLAVGLSCLIRWFRQVRPSFSEGFGQRPQFKLLDLAGRGFG